MSLIHGPRRTDSRLRDNTTSAAESIANRAWGTLSAKPKSVVPLFRAGNHDIRGFKVVDNPFNCGHNPKP